VIGFSLFYSSNLGADVIAWIAGEGIIQEKSGTTHEDEFDIHAVNRYGSYTGGRNA
jgi:hypothetical protein